MTSLGTQESWDAGQVLGELAVSLTVQALWDHLGRKVRAQLKQFVRLDRLGLATLKLSRMQISRKQLDLAESWNRSISAGIIGVHCLTWLHCKSNLVTDYADVKPYPVNNLQILR